MRQICQIIAAVASLINYHFHNVHAGAGVPVVMAYSAKTGSLSIT